MEYHNGAYGLSETPKHRYRRQKQRRNVACYVHYKPSLVFPVLLHQGKQIVISEKSTDL